MNTCVHKALEGLEAVCLRRHHLLHRSSTLSKLRLGKSQSRLCTVGLSRTVRSHKCMLSHAAACCAKICLQAARRLPACHPCETNVPGDCINQGGFGASTKVVVERHLDHGGVVHDGHPSGRLPGDEDVGGGRDVVGGDEAPDNGRDDALAPELVRPCLRRVSCSSRQKPGSIMDQSAAHSSRCELPSMIMDLLD